MRRQFMALLGEAITWSLAADAQQTGKMAIMTRWRDSKIPVDIKPFTFRSIEDALRKPHKLGRWPSRTPGGRWRGFLL